LGKTEDTGAEADLPRAVDHGREERERRADALGPRGEMLADEGLREIKLVGQDNRLPVFLEDGGVVPARVMERHREQTELDAHGGLLDPLVRGSAGGPLPARRPPAPAGRI